jgi:PhzF family phenazine biosynthesis protein
MIMKQRAFKQVDVFTDVAYKGNPLAVVLDGEGLSTEDMQHFTNWTNLSECTFLLPATHASADYQVRIFCPGRELPFAGHPTLGSCHAWLKAGGKPKGEYIVQECGIGLVKIKRDAHRLAFAAPELKKGGALPEADVQIIARGLGLARSEIVSHAWCDNGPHWRGVMLTSAARVLSVCPNEAILKELGGDIEVGVVGAYDSADAQRNGVQFEVRAFFPGNNGLCEDPVTGSLNAALAQWLIGAGIAPPRYVASQGTALARSGRVHVSQEGADIWIGGASITCVDGKVVL